MKCRAVLERGHYPAVELIAEVYEHAEEGTVVARLNHGAALALIIDLALACHEGKLYTRGEATKIVSRPRLKAIAPRGE